MSTESHPSPTGSSSSSLFGGGGGGSAGASEPLTQPSPAKPTWAQILNSNPTNAASHHSGTSAPTKTKAVSPSASGANNNNNNPNSRSGPMSNIYEHQQQPPMNWPLNFNRSSPWMNEDDSQRHPNPSQPSMDNDRQTGGDAFDQLDSSSPTSEWNKPVSSSNSNGWSNFAPQHPSRSNANNNSSSSATGNQWLEMNNFYGGTTSTSSVNSGNSFNFSQHTNETTTTTSNAGNTWQDPSAGNAAETLPSSSNNALLSKHKTSSTTSSMSGALKGGNAGGSAAAADLLRDPNEPMVPYVPQPKLVEQLGWDEPEIQVIKRPNFDDGTSIWGDPMESAAVPVKKWTNGTKGALTNATNTIQQQSTPPPSTPVNPPISASQPLVAKPVSSGNASSQMVLNDENWPKQQSPTLGQPSSSSLQWNDSSMLEQSNLSQQMNYRNQTNNNNNNWNPPSQQQGNQSSGDWINEGMVDTSSWGLQGAPHKTPFDPYDGMVDTSGWGVQGPPGGMPGGMPPMSRNRFANEFNPNEDLHHARMPAPYENPSFNDPYRQPSDAKSSMMGLGNLLPSNPHSFVPRPGPLYPPPPSSENILRPSNHNGGLSTPPGAMMGHSNPLSPKLVNSSPIPNQVPYAGGMPGKSSSMGNQTPTPSQQQQLSGNAGGNNPNGNNNGAVHAQIMQQFRLAVQAGLISQDLLNTKLPPYMLQLLQKLFELQQKFQNFSLQLSELNKQKGRFPLTVFQNEYDQLSKSIDQKKQEMLTVQKEIQDAHNKLKQQPGNSNASQLMTNNNNRSNTGGGGGGGDQSRLHKWTKPANPSGQRPGMFPPPPGLTPKDWQTDSHDSNDNWDPSQTNESNPNNQMGHNSDSQIHHHHHHQHQQHHHQQQHQSSYADPFSSIVDDIDGPPPFIPGQLWNWKASMPNAEEDPHATPGSFTIGPKGLSSPMGNLNVGGVDSAFSNPSLMHQYPRHQQSNRSQWQQGSLHDQQGFPPSMNDWNKPPPQQQQFRGTSKPPHPSFGGGGGSGGGYRPYT